jgi:hypothetical protein
MTIPKTLDEAFVALDDLLSEEDREFIQQTKDSERVAIRLHHTLGRHLRNEWGFWRNSELAQHITREHGLVHPDDMSHFILVRYSRAWLPTRWDRLVKDEP